MEYIKYNMKMCNLKIIKGTTVYVLETSWQGHWKTLRSIEENIK